MILQRILVKFYYLHHLGVGEVVTVVVLEVVLGRLGRFR